MPKELREAACGTREGGEAPHSVAVCLCVCALHVLAHTWVLSIVCAQDGMFQACI